MACIYSISYLNTPTMFLWGIKYINEDLSFGGEKTKFVTFFSDFTLLTHSKSQFWGGLWTHRINIALILHYPQPPALCHVVGNPLAADYCNPTECLDDTSDHDKKKRKKEKKSPAACSRCTSSKNKGIKLRYALTHCLLLLKASAAVPVPFPGPVDLPDRHWQRLGIIAQQSVGIGKALIC